MAEPKTNEIDSVELLLNGSILRTPIKISGAFEKGNSVEEKPSVFEFWGSAAYRKSLLLFLEDLADNIDPSVGTKLTELLGEQVKNIRLESLTFGYRTANPKIAQFIVTMSSGGNRSDFSAIKNMQGDGFVIGLNLRSDDTFLKSNVLAGLIGEIAIKNLGVHYASQELKQVPCYPLEALGADGSPPINFLGTPKRDFSEGWKVSADILIGGVNLFDALTSEPDKEAASSANETPTPALEPASANTGVGQNSKDSIYWIEANKIIGPLSLRRVGLGYQSPRIAIKLDAGLQLSCLSFTLEGLGLSYPIDQLSTDPRKIWEHLQFNLDGASLSFAQEPLAISGGMLKVSDDPLQLDGTLLVKSPLFAISAIASYANLNGTPSFFMFAALQKELGGPAFFFITGLAFGFGVNRVLKLPTINEVENFPLIKAATDENYLGTKLDLRGISQKLDQYISPSEGNYWIAAGIKFTSFGQINSFVLLSVAFGTRLEFGLLGLSKLQVPKPLPDSSGKALSVIVYAEMAIRAVVAPDTGLLCFEARLTENSFLLRKDFKLRGGFAFYSWFAGEHEGDFVVSIGGYHNKFKLPTHYPRPDLVEFSCRIGDAVTIQGDCYFALCPSAIMAGGRLSIVYQTQCIRAWFIAYAHFLIQWKPVYYDISIGVSIGVAARIEIGIIRVNLSVELSASANLYGPPLGGEARISLYVVSFTVKFGEERHAPPPLLWESTDVEKSFAKSFLPNPHVTTITIADGLLKENKMGEDTPSIISAQKLVLTARTLVPATAVCFNEETPKDSQGIPLTIPQPTVSGQPAKLGVRPMNKRSLYSRIDVSLAPDSDTSKEARQYLAQYLELSITTKSVPIALWGASLLDNHAPPTEQMIDNTLAGLEIRTRPGPRSWETPVLDLSVLAYDPYQKPFDWANIKPGEALSGFKDKTISNTIAATEVVERRTGILEVLIDTGRSIMKPEDIHLDQLLNSAEYIFQDMPAMARVGQYPPRAYLDT